MLFSNSRPLLRTAGTSLASALRERLAQEVFDLAVHAAQFCSREPLEFRPQGGIDAQCERLFIGTRHDSRIERACIHDRLHRVLGAQDHHEVADHGGFALVIELHHVVL
jgi:hypothetical protein